MKASTILLVCAICFISTSVLGQEQEVQRKNGIRAGYQLSNMVNDGNKPDTAQNLSSFYVGYFRSKKIAPILHFESGLEYFQNGLKYSNDYERVIHTLSIPVDLKVKIGPFYGLGGITANFKLSEHVDVPFDTMYPESQKTKGFDSAVFAGAGIKILFLSLDARYHWGLIEVRDDLYNRYFQIGATVSF